MHLFVEGQFAYPVNTGIVQIIEVKNESLAQVISIISVITLIALTTPRARGIDSTAIDFRGTRDARSLGIAASGIS